MLGHQSDMMSKRNLIVHIIWKQHVNKLDYPNNQTVQPKTDNLMSPFWLLTHDMIQHITEKWLNSFQSTQILIHFTQRYLDLLSLNKGTQTLIPFTRKFFL